MLLLTKAHHSNIVSDIHFPVFDYFCLLFTWLLICNAKFGLKVFTLYLCEFDSDFVYLFVLVFYFLFKGQFRLPAAHRQLWKGELN